MGSEEGSGL